MIDALVAAAEPALGEDGANMFLSRHVTGAPRPAIAATILSRVICPEPILVMPGSGQSSGRPPGPMSPAASCGRPRTG